VAAPYRSCDGVSLRSGRSLRALGTTWQSGSRLGDLTGFNAYVAKLNWFVPAGLIPVVGWASTTAETGLALALLIGWKFALGVARQCTATTFIRSYDDSGIGPQGAAGLLGLHRSSRSIPALRYSAKSHERNMNMRGAAKSAKV